MGLVMACYVDKDVRIGSQFTETPVSVSREVSRCRPSTMGLNKYPYYGPLFLIWL